MYDRLIEKVKKKERKAQHLLYQQFASLLFRLVYRYVTNEQDAGSIVNMAFFRIDLSMKTLTAVLQKI